MTLLAKTRLTSQRRKDATKSMYCCMASSLEVPLSLLQYRLLGTKKEQKKHLIYESGHNIPRNELVKVTLNWLDQQLGTAQ
jgi:hypothetical protein